MKRVAAFALALCLLSWTVCAPAKSEEITGIILPEPEITVEGMIIGDYAEPVNREITLYYPSEDGNNLTTLTRSITAERGDQLVEAVLYELLEGSMRRSSVRSWSPDIHVLDSEFACGTVTVNLSVDAGVHQGDMSYLLLCRSIANTLLSMDEVQAVNILTAGRSENLCSLPAGVFTTVSDAVTADFALLQSEKSLFLGENTGSIVRNALIYYPSKDGRYLLPEVHALEFVDENYLTTLMSALSAEPHYSDRAFPVIPTNLNPLEKAPEIIINGAGERIARLELNEMLLSYLAFSGAEPWQLYGSMVLTLCSFLPELDGLELYVGGEPVMETGINDALVGFDGSILRRSDFSHLIGSSAPRYFSDENGTLIRMTGAVSPAGASSARGILAEMITAVPDEGLFSVFPADITGADILGVRVENGAATVNLSAAFYAACQIYTPEQERSLIYAMVNALCELDQVGSVRFLVEGRVIESLAQNIYLKSSLMPNPSLTESKPEG